MCFQETHSLIGMLSSNADWGKVDGSALKTIEDNPEEAGILFTKFLRSFERKEVRPSKIIKIGREALLPEGNIYNTVKTLLGPGWTIIDENKKSLRLTEIDMAKIYLKSGLEEGEEFVQGDVKLSRLKKEGYVTLDFAIFNTFWKSPELIPEEWKLKTNNETTFICFDGTMFLSPMGERCAIFLFWKDKWLWRFQSFRDLFDAATPSAVLSEEL